MELGRCQSSVAAFAGALTSAQAGTGARQALAGVAISWQGRRRKPWPKQSQMNTSFVWGQDVFKQAGTLRTQMAFNSFCVCSPMHRLQVKAGARWSAPAHLQTRRYRLLIRNTLQSDSGWERCMPGEAQPSQVRTWNNFSSAWPSTSTSRLTLTYLGTLRAGFYFSDLKSVLLSQLGSKMWKGELTHGSPRDQ